MLNVLQRSGEVFWIIKRATGVGMKNNNMKMGTIWDL